MEIKDSENTKVIFVVDAYKLREVLADKRLTTGAKLVLLNLKSRLGGKDYCFPSQETIGKDLGLSARQVRTHVKTLVSKKIIFVKKRALNQKKEKHMYSNEYNLTNILKKKTINDKSKT